MRGYHARQTLRRAGTLLMGPIPVKGKFRFGAAVLSSPRGVVTAGTANLARGRHPRRGEPSEPLAGRWCGGSDVTKRHVTGAVGDRPASFPLAFPWRGAWHDLCVFPTHRMLPTSSLPVFPMLGTIGMGTLLGTLAAGALGALLVGLVLHRREHRREAAIAMGAPGAAATGDVTAPKVSGTRLSA